MKPDVPTPTAASQATPAKPEPAQEVRYISGFWRRLSALSLDLLILTAAMAYPAYRWFGFFSTHPGWTLLTGFAIGFLYFVPLNSRIGGGQTVGKRLRGIRVVNIRGEPISIGGSAFRFLVFATPFFAGNVQFTCNGRYCALTTVMNWIFVGWGLIIAYLYIFNRRTGQSLHDLLAGTYAIKTSLWHAPSPQSTLAEDALSPYLARPTCVTSQKVWLGHGKIVLAGLTAVLVFVVTIWPEIVQRTSLGEMMQIQQAVLRSGKARWVGVKLTIGNGKAKHVPRRLEVSYVPARNDADEIKQAAEIAAVVLEASPKAMQADMLDIVKVRSAEFGFIHFSANKTVSHTPDQWKIIILATGAGKRERAALKLRAPDSLLTLS